MDGVGPDGSRRADHRGDIEVARRRRGRPDPDDGIGEHRLDAELAAAAQDAHRDLAPVGDEDAPQDHPSSLIRISTVPCSANSAFATQISATVPATPAATEFISFIVSMMPTTVCSPTMLPMST